MPNATISEQGTIKSELEARVQEVERQLDKASEDIDCGKVSKRKRREPKYCHR